MVKYLLRRVGGWLLMIIIATNITYFLANFFLHPRSLYVGRRPPLPEAQVDALLDANNLNDKVPIFERWWVWIKGIVLHWDWGNSPTGDPVNGQIAFRIPVSAELMMGAFILYTLIGIGLGVYAASRQYRPADRINQALSIITLNIPVVVAGLGIVLLAIKFNQAVGHRVFYVTGSRSADVHGLAAIPDILQHLALPTIVLIITQYASTQMLQRSLLLDNISADYVRMARAKGLTKSHAIRKHALRPSLIPVATQVAFSIPALFTGAVLTETIFNWEGMGKYFIDTINKMDVNGVVAVAAFGALMTAVGAVLADIAVVALDPRVRVS
ncbi:ABC transporter permease [Microlunatus elymi]|uniref:ABC transporter permease n=1 Tax=Microlunatus elymi TaxID=2596828 RepID=A0A516Q4A3_9ACTN|nr:ABC transporter permease [Microlunatus elymi]QDP98041.1 ABC transporter permease [Microlunatus elymi]